MENRSSSVNAVVGCLERIDKERGFMPVRKRDSIFGHLFT